MPTVAKTDLQDGVALNKILGWAYRSVANRSRKLNGFAATQMKRQLSIPPTHGDTEVYDSLVVSFDL